MFLLLLSQEAQNRAFFLALSKNNDRPSAEIMAMTELFCQHIGETVNRLNESARAEKRAIDLATVSNIGRLMIARLTLKEMVEEIIAQLGAVLEADEINVILYDDEKKGAFFSGSIFLQETQALKLWRRALCPMESTAGLSTKESRS